MEVPICVLCVWAHRMYTLGYSNESNMELEPDKVILMNQIYTQDNDITKIPSSLMLSPCFSSNILVFEVSTTNVSAVKVIFRK